MTDKSSMLSRSCTRLLSACIVGALAIFATAPAKAATPEDIKKKGEVTFGIITDQPPFSYIDGNGQNKGYDIDLTRLIAEDLGVKPRYVTITSANRIPQLVTNRIDILAMAFGIFPDRAEVVDYIAPYATITASVYGPKEKNIEKPEDLIGYTIAVERGSSVDTDISNLAPKGANILRYEDAASSVQAFLTGQADLLGSYNHLFKAVDASAPGKYEAKIEVVVSPLSYAVSKQSPELKAKVRDLMIRLRDDGTLDKLHQAHFGTEFPFKTFPNDVKGVKFDLPNPQN